MRVGVKICLIKRLRDTVNKKVNLVNSNFSVYGEREIDFKSVSSYNKLNTLSVVCTRYRITVTYYDDCFIYCELQHKSGYWFISVDKYAIGYAVYAYPGGFDIVGRNAPDLSNVPFPNHYTDIFKLIPILLSSQTSSCCVIG